METNGRLGAENNFFLKTFSSFKNPVFFFRLKSRLIILLSSEFRQIRSKDVFLLTRKKFKFLWRNVVFILVQKAESHKRKNELGL